MQGVDVWLNNPRRPLEASGTSGMKVVLNGGLNLSVLDGWWAEAYDGAQRLRHRRGRDAHQPRGPGRARRRGPVSTLLEKKSIPLFYERDRDGLPRGWIARMKRAIRTLGWRFNADRMVMDYVLNSYIPAAGGTSSDISRFRRHQNHRGDASDALLPWPVIAPDRGATAARPGELAGAPGLEP